MPNHYLIKTKSQSPKETKRIISKLKRKNKQETLKNIYKFTTKQYSSDNPLAKRLKLVFLYPTLFQYDISKYLKRKQFLACHQQVYLFKTLLLNTNQFQKKDIQEKTKIQPYLISHKYLIVNTGKEKYKIDPFFNIFKKLKK